MITLIYILMFLVARQVTTNCLLGQLLPKVIADVIGILTNGVRHIVGNCSNIIEAENRLMLYNRQNVEPILLNSLSANEIDPNKPTVCIIHGWLSNGKNAWPQVLKNTYLNSTDVNVVVVDWSPYAEVLDYTSAVCNVPAIGKQLGDLLCKINTTLGVDLETVHIVGHSLGAHIAGFAGQQVKSACGKIVGRITGLDPAGPGYQDIAKSKRLDSEDADFVDVIHTNQGVAGYYGQVGDVDFYPNCGTLQPGCLRINVSNVLELLGLPISTVLCHHSRSTDYYIESVKSSGFKALSCKYCPLICRHNIFWPSQIAMGAHCPKDLGTNSYVLETNAISPYAQG